MQSFAMQAAQALRSMKEAPEASYTGDRSLLEYLDLSQTNCLNEDSEHTLKSILASKTQNTSENFLSSDADEQLLLNISFNQTVRVRSITIKSSNVAQAPKTIKLLVNRPSIGFEDVENANEGEVAQILDLTDEDVRDGKPVPLRYVRFQMVNSLHIFVQSNHGGEDETRIDAVNVVGVPTESMKDLSGLKKIED